MAKRPTPEHQANMMRGSRSKNTRPERFVRSLLHRLGYRYRIHDKRLPGSPDIAFTKRKRALFVHGCFWHQHESPVCPVVRRPDVNNGFWSAKFDRNKRRDALNIAALESAGWHVEVIWECDLRSPRLAPRLKAFLGPPRAEQ
jgi:DNA mismatch endonuclease Vsr